jgi:tetratricopeptide (TPR) repeat protein
MHRRNEARKAGRVSSAILSAVVRAKNTYGQSSSAIETLRTKTAETTAETEVVFDSVSVIPHESYSLADGLRGALDVPPWGKCFLWLFVFLTLPTSPPFSWASGSAQASVQAGFDSLAKSAAAAREAGKTEEAIRDYKRAVDIRADWEEGWWYLGTLQYDTDRFADAIPALEKVVQLDPALGPAWNFLGLCEFETHDYGNSLEHLQKGQELGTGDDPEISRVSRYHLALLLNRNGEFEKASAILASAFADQAPTQVKVALGLALLRVPLLPQEVDPSQDALVQAAGETASILAPGDPARTFNSFRALLRKYPDAPYLHYTFGIALASAGHDDEALLQEQEEVKISPSSALPYIEISLLELRLKHPQNALRAGEMAVQLASDSSAAHRGLAQSLQALGQEEKSGKELSAAETLAPEKPVREERIIQMYAHGAAAVSPGPAQGAASEEQWNLAMQSYSAGHFPEAITALKAYVARNPNNGTAWAVMGLSEYEIKDYTNAWIHLQRGQDLGLSGSPESVQLARCRLATLLNRNAEFDRATELLATEAGSGAHSEEIQFALGMALLRIPLLPDQVEASKIDLVRTAGDVAALLQDSKYDEAFPKLQTLLRQYPDTPFLHYAYGTALVALSQYDDAEAQFRKELTISPSSELPHVGLASTALKTRRPADALPSAQRAAQIAPDSAEAHYLLGRSYLELGQEEKAVQELETARRLAPDSPEVHFNLAKAYAKANRPEKAEQERAIFARLNALAEQQRSRRGNQSYSGSHDQSDFTIPRVESNTPETH